jgi:D-glycero-D-manno-heptose 1,7-bisphosphate phosphatase
MRPALFLDRDGVINVDVGHAHRIDQIKFVDGIFELVASATAKGYFVAIVTNQAGIAKGLYTEDVFNTLSQWMLSEFVKHGGNISHVAFCPHHEQAVVPALKVTCVCRKPAPGMIVSTVEKFGLDIGKSILVGDHMSDLIAGAAAGIHMLYLLGKSDVLAPLAGIESSRLKHIVSLSEISLQEVTLG